MSKKEVYFLGSSPRSGSTIVAEVLRTFGAFGRIDEFVSDATRALWEPRGIDYLQDCLSRHDGPLAGLKVHFQEFLAILMSSAWTMMGEPRFLYLSRDDKLGQAISFVRAIQTYRFSSADFNLAIKPRYDYEAILRALDFILDQEHGWNAYFAARGLTPYRFTYERFLRNPEEVCAEIAAYLDVQIEPQKIDLSTFAAQIQRDASTEEWRHQFIQQTRAKLASGPFDSFLGLERFARWYPYEKTSYDYAVERNDLALISRAEDLEVSGFVEAQEILAELGYLKESPQIHVTRALAQAVFDFQRDREMLVDLRLTPGCAGVLRAERENLARINFSGEWIERTNKAALEFASTRIEPTSNGLMIKNEYRNTCGDLIAWTAELTRATTGELLGALVHEEPHRSQGYRDALLCLRVCRDGRELLGTVQPVGLEPTVISFVKAGTTPFDSKPRPAAGPDEAIYEEDQPASDQASRRSG